MIVLWGGPVIAIVIVYAVLWQLTAPLRRGREARMAAQRQMATEQWVQRLRAEEAHREMVHEQDRFLREQRREDRRIRT